VVKYTREQTKRTVEQDWKMDMMLLTRRDKAVILVLREGLELQ
jgi:hypothetical protein